MCVCVFSSTRASFVRLLRPHLCFFVFLGVLEYARGSHLWKEGREVAVELNVAEGFHGNDEAGVHTCLLYVAIRRMCSPWQ